MNLHTKDLAAIETLSRRSYNSFARKRARAKLLKRFIDVSLSLIALFLLAPILLSAMLAIKLESSGPVVFRQTRRGLHGRPFKIMKLRTMRVLEDGSIIEQAKREDRRVTRVGRLLRQTSIDELPQLVNVLRGEMSLVGPRPHAVAHDEYYGRLIDSYDFRHAVKPGITGWAQVNGARGETPEIADMERRIELDLWYVRYHSPALDLKIIALTAIQILRCPNAF